MNDNKPLPPHKEPLLSGGISKKQMESLEVFSRLSNEGRIMNPIALRNAAGRQQAARNAPSLRLTGSLEPNASRPRVVFNLTLSQNAKGEIGASIECDDLTEETGILLFGLALSAVQQAASNWCWTGRTATAAAALQQKVEDARDHYDANIITEQAR